MSLRDKLENLVKSEIYKLIYEGSIVGLRVKIFNVVTDTFEYYDFTLKTVSGNQTIKNFVNKLQANMTCIELIEHDGVYASQEEISGSIDVKEFKSEYDAIRVLEQVKTIYELSK